MPKIIVAALLCLAPAVSSAYCFLVYNGSGNLVYRSVFAPIDLSLPISQGLAARFPGGHLTFLVDESSCIGFEQSPLATANASRTPSGSVAADRGGGLDASPLFMNSRPMGVGGEPSGAAAARRK